MMKLNRERFLAAAALLLTAGAGCDRGSSGTSIQAAPEGAQVQAPGAKPGVHLGGPAHESNFGGIQHVGAKGVVGPAQEGGGVVAPAKEGGVIIAPAKEGGVIIAPAKEGGVVIAPAKEGGLPPPHGHK